MPKKLREIDTVVSSEEDGKKLLKTMGFRRGKGGIYYRKRRNMNIGQPDFEHDRASLIAGLFSDNGWSVRWEYTYKTSNGK